MTHWKFTFAGNDKESGLLTTFNVKRSGSKGQMSALRNAIFAAEERLDGATLMSTPERCTPFERRKAG